MTTTINISHAMTQSALELLIATAENEYNVFLPEHVDGFSEETAKALIEQALDNSAEYEYGYFCGQECLELDDDGEMPHWDHFSINELSDAVRSLLESRGHQAV